MEWVYRRISAVGNGGNRDAGSGWGDVLEKII